MGQRYWVDGMVAELLPSVDDRVSLSTDGGSSIITQTLGCAKFVDAASMVTAPASGANGTGGRQAGTEITALRARHM
jgi:hypothetical protein